MHHLLYILWHYLHIKPNVQSTACGAFSHKTQVGDHMVLQIWISLVLVTVSVSNVFAGVCSGVAPWETRKVWLEEQILFSKM